VQIQYQRGRDLFGPNHMRFSALLARTLRCTVGKPAAQQFVTRRICTVEVVAPRVRDRVDPEGLSSGTFRRHAVPVLDVAAVWDMNGVLTMIEHLMEGENV
jgi:hypothetical protein